MVGILELDIVLPVVTPNTRKEEMTQDHPIAPLEPGLLNLHEHIHNNPSPDVGLRHINLSEEVHEYRPWRLGNILRPYIGNKKK
jgi:hypothetical protein